MTRCEEHGEHGHLVGRASSVSGEVAVGGTNGRFLEKHRGLRFTVEKQYGTA